MLHLRSWFPDPPLQILGASDMLHLRSWFPDPALFFFETDLGSRCATCLRGPPLP